MSIPPAVTDGQSTTDAAVLSVLDGTPCPACESGILERGTYKDNRAMICDACAVPRVQVWS